MQLKEPPQPSAGVDRPAVYHIPVCPFSQRLEILLSLKGLCGEVDLQVVDITRPRPPRDKYGYSATDEELGL